MEQPTRQFVESKTMGPLSGIKIIELAGIGPGPYCGMMLSYMGADVIRSIAPAVSFPAYPEKTSRMYWRDGRKTIAVDLKRRKAQKWFFGFAKRPTPV
jgi:alpha-methylacyl-CoA racemase